MNHKFKKNKKLLHKIIQFFVSRIRIWISNSDPVKSRPDVQHCL